MATKKKEVKVRDLKPSKDAKGGAAGRQRRQPLDRGPAGRTTQSVESSPRPLAVRRGSVPAQVARSRGASAQ